MSEKLSLLKRRFSSYQRCSAAKRLERTILNQKMFDVARCCGLDEARKGFGTQVSGLK